MTDKKLNTLSFTVKIIFTVSCIVLILNLIARHKYLNFEYNKIESTIHGINIFLKNGGSGNYLSVFMVKNENFEKASKKSNTNSEEEFLKFLTYTIQPQLDIYESGELIIGNFDFDSGVEIATYTFKNGFKISSMEILPDGKVKSENNSMILFSILISIFSFPLSVILTILSALFISIKRLMSHKTKTEYQIPQN